MSKAELRPAAFFDLDRTLVEGSSGVHWARALYGAGLVGRRQLLSDLLLNIRFRIRGSTDREADAVRERVGRVIEGVPVLRLQRLAHQVLAGVLPRLYPQMLATAHEHQDSGRPIYICTAASQEMADLMAHVLGFDGAVGTRSEVVDGVYTGRPAGPFAYGEGKAILMRELAATERIDMGASYAYSDSASDLPMLRAVGNPVAVNPDDGLARIAAAEGWPVMRFDPLRRRLRIGGALAAGGVGAAVAASRRRVRGRIAS